MPEIHAVLTALQDLVEEIASPKYEDCWYSNLTYEHSGFRFQVLQLCKASAALAGLMSGQGPPYIMPSSIALHPDAVCAVVLLGLRLESSSWGALAASHVSCLVTPTVALPHRASQIINGTLWVDHLPWHNYDKGVPWNALSPDSYNECVLRLKPRSSFDLL